MEYTIQDDRTPEEKAKTIGFMVATDRFLSGWGNAPGRSIVAVPVVSFSDRETVENRLNLRNEMKRVRFVGPSYRPRLYPGDHLHIYNTKHSFRYPV